MEATGYGYLHSRADAEDGFAEGRVRPWWSVSSGALFVYVEGDVRVDTSGYARGLPVSPADRSGSRRVADLREAFFETDTGWARLRVGQQVFDWSVTDTISPADNLSPRDWIDLIRWERVGAPAAALRFGSDSLLEVVWLPLFISSRLPPRDGRWMQPLPPGVDLAAPRPSGSRRGQFGARAGHTVGGVDLGLVFFDGHSHSPEFKWESTGTKVTVVPVQRRERVWAGSAAASAGGWSVRGEAGYFRQDQADDFLLFTLGADREWDSALRGGDSLYALLQYGNDQTTRRHQRVGEPKGPADFRRSLSHAALFTLRYRPGGSSRVSGQVRGTYHLSDRDYYLEPSLIAEGGGLRVEVGLGLIGGPRDSFLGAYGDNDRLFARGEWRF
ncbi:MAG: hypothetical protein ACNA8S_09930 [Deferrisomatales bacterium]